MGQNSVNDFIVLKSSLVPSCLVHLSLKGRTLQGLKKNSLMVHAKVSPLSVHAVLQRLTDEPDTSFQLYIPTSGEPIHGDGARLVFKPHALLT